MEVIPMLRSTSFLGLGLGLGLTVLTTTAGCGDGTTTNDTGPAAGDCSADIQGEWESVNEFECPLVGMDCVYHQTLTIDANDFEWNPSELVEGELTCADNQVEAVDGFGAPAFTATYDPDSDTLELSWDAADAPEPYRRVAP